jgi:hypothetical protein
MRLLLGHGLRHLAVGTGSCLRTSSGNFSPVPSFASIPVRVFSIDRTSAMIVCCVRSLQKTDEYARMSCSHDDAHARWCPLPSSIRDASAEHVSQVNDPLDKSEWETIDNLDSRRSEFPSSLLYVYIYMYFTISIHYNQGSFILRVSILLLHYYYYCYFNYPGIVQGL